MQTEDGRNNLMSNAKKHLFVNKHEKQDDSKGFKMGMSYEQYQMGAGKGRHEVAYFNMDIMRSHDRKHKRLMQVSKGLGRFSKEARQLRNELVDLRDPLTWGHIDFEKQLTANFKSGRASMAKCGVTLKRGAFKGGFVVTGKAQVADIFQKDPETNKRDIKGNLEKLGAFPNPVGIVQGFFSFDTKLKGGSTVSCGVFVTKTVSAKLEDGKFNIGKKTEVRGQVDFKSKDGWMVSTKLAKTKDDLTGEESTGVHVKFKDTHAFGINGLLIDANIAFKVQRNAQGKISFSKDQFTFKKPTIRYNPTFQPKWLKDLRDFQEKGTTSFATFKEKSGANLAIETYHKSTHQIRDWSENVKDKWRSVTVG